MGVDTRNKRTARKAKARPMKKRKKKSAYTWLKWPTGLYQPAEKK